VPDVQSPGFHPQSTKKKKKTHAETDKILLAAIQLPNMVEPVVYSCNLLFLPHVLFLTLSFQASDCPSLLRGLLAKCPVTYR
jgi:hypothetical protein